MIVIIPVHEGDRDLCIKNLGHALILEEMKKVDFRGVIHHEEGLEIGEVVKAAQCYFTSVGVSTYPKWTGNKSFPWPQNNAWIRAAQYVESNIKDHFLWWEADAIPLRARWLHDLSDCRNHGGRPFAGCSVFYGGYNYMGGVGIYPPNPSELMLQAMLANGQSRPLPWDIVAGTQDHILHKTHDISALIHHVPDFPNTHFDSMDDVKRKVKDTALIFHKCKDGSLIDVLQGKNTPAAPSVLPLFEQHWEWPGGLFAFPYDPFVCYFNCSIIEKGGKRFLFTRRQNRKNPQAFQNDLAIWEIRPNMTLKFPPIVPVIPRKIGEGEQFDDPKAILSTGGKVLVSLAHWVQKKPWPCRQLIIQLTDDLRGVELMLHPQFGGNHPNPEKAERPEKNWGFLNEPHSPIKMVYSINPHVVFSGNQRWENPKLDLPWEQQELGEPRGGTPAIDVGTHWLSFFHSSIPWSARQRRYVMGAYAFSKKAPYEITHFTRHPILQGSEDDFRLPCNPPVCFPNGALYDGKEFLVVFGVNDQDSGWIKINAVELTNLLEPI